MSKKAAAIATDTINETEDSATQPENLDFLPPGYKPFAKDIICGRARENFHHDGNRYFRELMQDNAPLYIAAKTKIEKSEVIAVIVNEVRQSSPLGGFIKKDPTSGRWCRMKEGEARDKVGHALRKAAQRLEETKPKLVARLKQENIALPRAKNSKRKLDESCQSTYYSEKRDEAAKPKAKIDKRGATQSIEDQGSSEVRERVHPTGTNSVGDLVFSSGNVNISTDTLERLRPQNRMGSLGMLFSSNQLPSILSPAMPRLSLQNESLRNNISFFPPSYNLPSTFHSRPGDSAMLASNLLSQHRRFHNSNPLALTSLQSHFGLGALTSSQDKLLLTAAAIQQQKELHRAKELDYARRLAQAAMGYSQNGEVPWENARIQSLFSNQNTDNSGKDNSAQHKSEET